MDAVGPDEIRINEISKAFNHSVATQVKASSKNDAINVRHRAPNSNISQRLQGS